MEGDWDVYDACSLITVNCKQLITEYIHVYYKYNYYEMAATINTANAWHIKHLVKSNITKPCMAHAYVAHPIPVKPFFHESSWSDWNDYELHV